MRQITKIFNVYKYNEMTEEQKEKVLNNLSDINVNCEWWECIYDDAKQIGTIIDEFDIDRGNYCKLEYFDSPYEVADKIIKNHGESCNTYINAKNFQKRWDQLVVDHSDGININKVSYENESEFDEKADLLEKQFLSNLSQNYLKILKEEYNYRISNKGIEETIKCNEYEFTNDGKLY